MTMNLFFPPPHHFPILKKFVTIIQNNLQCFLNALGSTSVKFLGFFETYSYLGGSAGFLKKKTSQPKSKQELQKKK